MDLQYYEIDLEQPINLRNIQQFRLLQTESWMDLNAQSSANEPIFKDLTSVNNFKLH